jgi:riboflavin synthase
MFAGIITNTAKIKSHSAKKGSLFLNIEKPSKWKLSIGESVNTDGVCLTVTKINKGSYDVELMSETLTKTTFGKNLPSEVNLERSLSFGDKISGHFVTGHVDGMGKIEKIMKRGTSKHFFISYPKQFRSLLAKKGSITVDGVSLTLVEVTAKYFSVALLPYTLSHTTLGIKTAGERVNLEFDILAKYGKKIVKYKI